MTIEEAIKHCEEVAAGKTEQGKCPGCAADHKQLAEWLRELVALRAQQVSPPNDPLTLEQLREMDWEPAWVNGDCETELGKSGWAILWYCNMEKYVCVWWAGEEYADIPALENYGDTWTVYRRKPKEGE